MDDTNEYSYIISEVLILIMAISDIISPMIEELNCYCNILDVANGKTYNLKISSIDKSLIPILRYKNCRMETEKIILFQE